ncbi:MAG: T9SS type A sorting domain-containing protein [Bacteroidota bacterium]
MPFSKVCPYVAVLLIILFSNPAFSQVRILNTAGDADFPLLIGQHDGLIVEASGRQTESLGLYQIDPNQLEISNQYVELQTTFDFLFPVGPFETPILNDSLRCRTFGVLNDDNQLVIGRLALATDFSGYKYQQDTLLDGLFLRFSYKTYDQYSVLKPVIKGSGSQSARHFVFLFPKALEQPMLIVSGSPLFSIQAAAIYDSTLVTFERPSTPTSPNTTRLVFRDFNGTLLDSIEVDITTTNIVEFEIVNDSIAYFFLEDENYTGVDLSRYAVDVVNYKTNTRKTLTVGKTGTLMEVQIPFQGMAVAPDQSLYVGGTHFTPPYHSGTILPSDPLLAEAERSVFITKIRADGMFMWEHNFGGETNYFLTSVSTDSAGNCIAMGSYYDWQTNPDDKRDIFILKLDPDGNVISSTHEALAEPQTTPQLFPNPAHTTAHLRWPNLKTGFTYRVTDALGRTHLSGRSNTPELALDISALSSGLYFVEVQAGDQRHTLRLVRA